jgi:hypothetical protein
MELEAPIQQPDRSVHVGILVGTPLILTFDSAERDCHASPPAELILGFVNDLAQLVEGFSKKWLSLPVPAISFQSRLTHNWEFGTYEPYRGSITPVRVRQIWLPERLRILARSFVVDWTLKGVTYEGDQLPETDGTEEIPLAGGEIAASLNPSQRLRALRKVRAARLQAAVARARATTLVARYYERYGAAELLNGDDALSTDEEAA